MTPYKLLNGYRFFDWDQPELIRFPLRTFCRDLKLVGTILLSREGINVSVSGTAMAVEEFRSALVHKFQVPVITYKEYDTERLAWKKMLVKMKKEIITMGFPDIRPAEFTGPTLSPVEFKKWLSENREMTVLDTRNDYEVRLGKFKSAVDLHATSFTDFAKRAAHLPEEIKQKPVVMYCTGGIRCEKASALFLKHYGFKEVYQLEGGILQYFKDVGQDHYEGECLVFDRRVGLSGEELEYRRCFKCDRELTVEDIEHPAYEPFESCPSCFPRTRARVPELR